MPNHGNSDSVNRNIVVGRRIVRLCRSEWTTVAGGEMSFCQVFLQFDSKLWLEVNMAGSPNPLAVADPVDTKNKLVDIEFPAWGREYSGARVEGVFVFEAQDFVAFLLDNGLYLLNDFNDEGNCVYMRRREELDADMALVGATRLDFFSTY
jgi:hypothetical protein